MDPQQNNQGNNLLIYLLIFLLLILMVALALSIPNSLMATGIVEKIDINLEEYETLSMEELEIEKIQQEIRNLVIENNTQVTPIERVAPYATAITVILAIIGTFVTIWKQLSEQEKDREQREKENLRTLDNKFRSLVNGFFSPEYSKRISTIVLIRSFMRDEYSHFHDQLLDIVIESIRDDDGLGSMENKKEQKMLNYQLAKCFEKALRLKVDHRDKSENQEPLNLRYIKLSYFNFEELNLSKSDLAFANLTNPNFKEAILYSVKGDDIKIFTGDFTNATLNNASFNRAVITNTKFDDAKLIDANMEVKDLSSSTFKSAELQNASFKNSKLYSVIFSSADLNETKFQGADFNDVTLKTILKAENWDKAKFDEDIMEKLRQLQETQQTSTTPSL